MRVLFSTLFLALGFTAWSQSSFQIKGTLKLSKDTAAKVYLNYSSAGKRVEDSAVVKNGTYQFNGSVEEPILVRLRVAYTPGADGKMKAISFKKDMAAVYIENAPIKVVSTDSFSNISVTGSKSHKAYMALQAQLKPITSAQESLSKAYSDLYQKKDEAGMKALEAQFDSLDIESKKVYKSYIQANPKSPVALYAVRQFAGWDINSDEVDPVLALLPASAKATPSGKELMERVEIARKTGVGKMAMEFTQNDTAGVPVSLSSFKGKYVLIDFWASWCGPCRQENPNVVKAYQRFNEKGFTILGVSLDQPNAKEKWLKAIHDDQLYWTQVSDLKFWQNAVAVQYGIQAIPQNFLIDPTGKIVAKNLRGEALVEKLEELLK